MPTYLLGVSTRGMPGIDPEVMTHRLAVDERKKPEILVRINIY